LCQRLLKHFFTSAEINALIAPRTAPGPGGDHDPLTPPAGLDRIDAALRDAYAAAGARRMRLLRYDCGHQETPGMRVRSDRVVRRWL